MMTGGLSRRQWISHEAAEVTIDLDSFRYPVHFYLTVLHTRGLLRGNPLDVFVNIPGPAIGTYVFAGIIARQLYKHWGNERGTGR